MTPFVSRLKKVSRRFLTRPCILCGQSCAGPTDICTACQKDLPWHQSGCLRCGLPLPNNVTRCGQCLPKPLYFDRCICAFNYQFPVNRLILSFKNNEKLVYGKALSALFAIHLKDYQPLPDMLMAMPIHWITRRRRGFNQSGLIAADLCRQLNLPLLHHACKKIRWTAPQKSLNAASRYKNVVNAFEVTVDLNSLHIGLVDDVVTSMATTNSLSAELKKAGAREITILSLARASLP